MTREQLQALIDAARARGETTITLPAAIGFRGFVFGEIVKRDAAAADDNTDELSFSSEQAVVPRWYGGERLGHQPGEVDLSFLNSGRAPVILNHDTRGD